MKHNSKIHLLIIGAVLFPLGVNFIVISPSFMRIAGNQGDWIGFWGSYTGGVISVLGIYLTMRDDNKKRLEERRECVKPYLLLKSVLPRKAFEQNSELIYMQGYHIYFNTYADRRLDNKENYYSDYFIFRNEGLGIAVDIEFEYNKIKGSRFANFCISKDPNNFEYHIGIKEDLYNPQYPFLTIKFTDIYGNRYSQKFKITVSNNFEVSSLYITESYPPELLNL